MPKLVVLTAGMSGRTHELTVDKTTVGRVEDNTFQIAESSVSSHHCEILLQGSDVLIRDLNSTNGTFINNEKISEKVLKPGETLRLGQVEMRLEVDGMTPPAPISAQPAAAGAPSPVSAPAAPAPIAPKRAIDQTVVMQRGVSLNELEQGTARAPGFDTTSKVFSKKTNKTNKWFLIGGIIALVVIGLVILVAFSQIGR